MQCNALPLTSEPEVIYALLCVRYHLFRIIALCNEPSAAADAFAENDL